MVGVVRDYCSVVSSEFVKNPQIVQFLGNQCTLRRTDGALITTRYFNYIYNSLS